MRNGSPLRLVATSLIEAGVDVDFPVVWRAEAGLESVVQAAGRCNREGKAPIGDVFVFEPAEDDGRRPPLEIAQSASATRSVLRRHDDPLSLEAIRDYFQELYWLKGEDALDAKHILRQLRERRRDLNFPFETIAKEFRLIETAMVPVIVPYRGEDGADDTAERLLTELEWVERPARIARRLQSYFVQIPPLARAALLSAGTARAVSGSVFDLQFVVLTNLDRYRADIGLTWDDPAFRDPEGLLF